MIVLATMECQPDSTYSADVLTDDALLHVFSYLNVLERAVVARVCQRWNYLARHGELWKNVNLTTVSKSSLYASQSDLILSCRETDIINLINVYLGKCLKQIHLHIPVTNKIIRLLALRCPHLEFIDIESDPIKTDLSLLSCKLVTIYLRLPLRSPNRSPVGRFALFPLFRLENLYLQYGQVTDKLLCRLMQSYMLHKIAFDGCHWQLKCHKIPLLSLCLPELTQIELVACQFPTCRFLSRLVHHIATECTHLQSLIIIQPTSLDEIRADCSSLIIDICEQTELRQLILGGIQGLTVEAVVFMSHSLPNLIDIGFLNCHVTDEILKELSFGFPNLMSLDITGNKCISNIGLKYLKKHAYLEILKLDCCVNLSSDIIIETVLSLPKLNTFRLPDKDNYTLCQENLQSQKPNVCILNPLE